MGRPTTKVTAEQRKLVESMAAVGIPSELICRVIGVSGKTLRKHYRDELDLAETKADAEVAGFLFANAKKGNVTAQIFWLKTRAGWRETPQTIEHSGSVGTYDMSKLTTDEIRTFIELARRAAAPGPGSGTGAA
jgi:hypothetical protein